MEKEIQNKIEEIIDEKMKLMKYHFNRLMLQMVNEINKITSIYNQNGTKK